MPAMIDLSGKTFDRWTVLFHDGWKGSQIMWRCRCECGTERSVSGGNLRKGLTKSCGCWNLERVRAPKKHGMTKSPEFRIWKLMIGRCTNAKQPDFPRYGGRGISVCDRWRHDFKNFYADMGPRPDGLTIERIDNNGNYDPKNCKWATNLDQQRNRRSNRTLEAFGRSQLMIDWERETGISSSLMHYHLKQGKTLEQIVRHLY